LARLRDEEQLFSHAARRQFSPFLYSLMAFSYFPVAVNSLDDGQLPLLFRNLLTFSPLLKVRTVVDPRLNLGKRVGQARRHFIFLRSLSCRFATALPVITVRRLPPTITSQRSLFLPALVAACSRRHLTTKESRDDTFLSIVLRRSPLPHLRPMSGLIPLTLSGFFETLFPL